MENEIIDTNKNDLFSSMRGFNLQELLYQIENFDLEYRDTLNLPKELTFGVEIEYENTQKEKVDNYINRHLNGWISKRDGSLFTGGEINSPIMTDDIKYWKELEKICNYLEKKNADTSHNAGGHIHIGSSILKPDDITGWRHFLKLYTAYEHIVFRFIYGDKLSARKNIKRYASPIADHLYRRLNKINQAKYLYEIEWILPYERNGAVNFNNIDFSPYPSREKQTIEFRSPNSSTNPTIWQNNINTFSKILVSSKEHVMDEAFLDYKLKNELDNLIERYNNLKNILEVAYGI